MSARGWTGSVVAAIGLAAATGAAQLGVGYGLGAIGWLGDAGGWAAALTWTVWVAALSVVIAALLARRRARASTVEDVEGGSWGRGLWRAAMACAAAVGGLAVVPLTALPAREVSTAATFAPALYVGWYAVVGVLLGLLLAVLALASRAVAANIIATGSWWWLVAVVTVLDAVAAGRGLVPTQLGVWRFTGGSDDAPSGEIAALGLPGDAWWHSIYVPGAVLTIGSALLIGLLAAMPAARRGEARVGVALSGLTGPVLFAAASVLPAPRLGGAPVEQLSALLVAPYAILAGLAGSVLSAVVFGTHRAGSAAAVPTGAAASTAASPVDKPLTPRQARNEEARRRAARDAEARHAAAQAARATSSATATAVATAPVESGWRQRLRRKPSKSSPAALPGQTAVGKASVTPPEGSVKPTAAPEPATPSKLDTPPNGSRRRGKKA
jgi:hypothetical protein